jgi:predicted Zn-dependent protease
MGSQFDARITLAGSTPLFDPQHATTRLDQRIVDPRIMVTSDPNDPDGGQLPFDASGYPIVPMTWIDRGVAKNLAFRADFAARMGYASPNDPPSAFRIAGAPEAVTLTVEEMIANCVEGVYVTRLAQVQRAQGDLTLGLLTGVTTGGCFLIRHGAIEHAIKDLRFVESPWLALSRLVALGTSARAAFGYAPWAGGWPIDPIIVPPLMIKDFNFTALADSV